MNQRVVPPDESLNATSDQSVPTTIRYRILAWLCAAATIAYMGRNCLGVASDAVQQSLRLDDMATGAAMSAFFWGYALCQIPSGWLGHHWGSRAALSLFAVMWSAACITVSLANGWWWLIVAQAAFGIAQAGLFPCAADAIKRWLPTSRRAFAAGSLGSFMSIGGAIGSALTGLYLVTLSWRSVFLLFALPGLAWAAGFALWFRNRPDQHPDVDSAELALIHEGKVSPPQTHGTDTPWRAMLLDFDVRMICGQQFFRAAGYAFYGTWFPKYLRETHGVSTEASGFLTGLPLLGVVMGGMLGGALVDCIWNRTNSRRLSRQAVGIASMTCCALLILAAYLVQDATSAVLLISAGSFCGAFAGSSAYTVTIEKAGEVVAPVFGLMNMSGNLGAALCPLVVGWFIVQTGNWQLVLLLFVGIHAAAALCWVFLNPNGTITDRRDVPAHEASS